MRLYVKPDEGIRFFRVELVLKRRVLRRLELEFPLSDVDEFDWLSFFNFRQLDFEGLRDYLIWLQRERIAVAAKEPRNWGSSLIVCHVDSAVSYLSDQFSLMEKVRYIKKTLNIDSFMRFLKPLDLINEEFMKMVKAQRFISDRGADRLIAEIHELR